MTARIGLLVGALVLAGVALWHPAPRPALQTTAEATFAARPADALRRRGGSTEHVRAMDTIVYVAGAVRRPGLYHARVGDRVAGAVAQAGGLTGDADAGGVNLAAHTSDGDEVYVPLAGENVSHRGPLPDRAIARGSHRRGANAAADAPASVDVNAADATDLARVPGIGKAIGARIVEMRSLDGSFRSLDELLDVGGMSQTRLERARPFLRPP